MLYTLSVPSDNSNSEVLKWREGQAKYMKHVSFP